MRCWPVVGAGTRPTTPTEGHAGEGPAAPKEHSFYADSPESESVLVERSTEGSRPEAHVVQKGDTLWSLSLKYLGSPWSWPKLWSYNPAITNPHWIYPGDLIRLGPGGAAAAAPASSGSAAADIPKLSRERAGDEAGTVLRLNGFVEPHELRAAGRILASKHERLMLAAPDEVYVQFNRAHALTPGERYAVYRPMRHVNHPVTGRRLGEIVEIFGEVRIESFTSPTIARGVILESYNPIERDFRVGPLRRPPNRVETKRDRIDLEGLVVATLQPRELIGTEMVVFVDRGKQDGVELGNRFLVVQQADGIQRRLSIYSREDRRLPIEKLAEILVVDLRERLCTGIVTSSLRETQVGDRVQARKGF
jgi:hypothetical protein